jgi:replication factor C subunit 2/4
MKVPYVPEGLEAIIFTADGDMRQALNNLQATHSGFHFVNQENVFKVTTQNWCITLVFIVAPHLENLRLSVVFQVCDQL